MNAKITVGVIAFLVGSVIGFAVSELRHPSNATAPVNQGLVAQTPQDAGVTIYQISKPENGFKPGGMLIFKFPRHGPAALKDALDIKKMDAGKSLDGQYLDVLADKLATVTGVWVWPKEVMLSWEDGSEENNVAHVIVYTDTWKIRRVDYSGSTLGR